MEITKGASVDKVFNLTEDTMFIGGNHLCPKIKTNGFALTLERIIPGANIDGSKDPADWPGNVDINCEWPDHLGKDYVYRSHKSDEATDGLRATLQSKDDHFEIFMFTVEWVHANPAGTAPDWRIAYLVEAATAEWWQSVDVVQTKLAELSGASSWAEFVAKILTKSPEVWRGLDVVVDKVVI